MAKRMSIINFKGGVGKSSFAFHLGCFLARRDAPNRVLLVDVDHQSTLSIIAMKPPNTWENAVTNGATCNRIFASFTTQGAAMPGHEIISRAPLGNYFGTLDILPAQLELDDTEIELAATTIGNPIISEWQKRTLLCAWLHDGGIDSQYDFILFDCPPATKIVSQNAIACSHAFAVPVIPDSVSSRGVTHLINLVGNRIDARLKTYAASVQSNRVPPTFVPDTALAGIVISMAQTHGASESGYLNEHWTQMNAIRRRFGADVLDNVIERATGVAESLGRGWPVFLQYNNVNVTNRDLPDMFNRVCRELVGKLGW
jgi:chromosome partitioning protein